VSYERTGIFVFARIVKKHIFTAGTSKVHRAFEKMSIFIYKTFIHVSHNMLTFSTSMQMNEI